jgi:hypothetical protein
VEVWEKLCSSELSLEEFPLAIKEHLRQGEEHGHACTFPNFLAFPTESFSAGNEGLSILSPQVSQICSHKIKGTSNCLKMRKWRSVTGYWPFSESLQYSVSQDTK